MNNTFKMVAKAILPPVVTDRLSFMVDNPWRHVATDKGGYFTLADGSPLFVRDTEADREVCKDIFLKKDYALRRSWREAALNAFYAQATAPLIVDAGANIGAASVWFAQTFPRAKIAAVEPQPDNFALLQKNVNRFPAVVPLHAAMAAEEGTLTVTDPGAGDWGFRTTDDPAAAGISVPALPIEKIVESLGEGEPFILKIDIEGAESNVFSRHATLFDQFPLLIIELHDWMLPKQGSSKNFIDWHQSMNRDFVYSGENVFSISHALP